MLHIIGVDHQVQAKQQNTEDSEDHKRFRQCLTATVKQVKPALIAEEYSNHALSEVEKRKKVKHQPLTKAIADSLKINHRFCDAEPTARKQMGYIEGGSIWWELWMNNDAGLSDDEIQDRAFAIEVVKYWPLRERYWLAQLQDVLNEEVIFVCGDAHIDTFRRLLQDNKIESAVIARGIGVTRRDSDFWDRVKKYVADHPDLSD